MSVHSASHQRMSCPSCRATFARPTSAQPGDKIRCPSCQQKIRLADGDPWIGLSVAGCTLLKRLGKGSMGSVYEGRREEDGAEVAVKLLSAAAAGDRELLARFRREAKLSQRLRHPNLIAGYASGSHEGAPYLVMELVRGAPLDRVVARSGAMDWRKATGLIRQISDAVAYLEAEGIVHRDIKPENVLIDADKIAKLADLGFAKELNETEESSNNGAQLTLAGSALGSPAYMAPEQVIDSAAADHATDRYCLGASYYHLVCGQLPFNGSSAMTVMEKVLHEEPPTPASVRPGLPKGVDALIRWMMAKVPQARPADMATVVAALERVLVEPDNTRGFSSGAGAGSGRPWKWLVLAILVVTALGVGAWFSGFFAG